MKYFRIAQKYFRNSNHYKGKRTPPWIKLPHWLMYDFEFSLLKDIHKYHFIGLLLFASKNENKLPFCQKFLKKQISASSKISLNEFLDKGFIELINDLDEDDASIPLAKCEQVADVDKIRLDKKKLKQKKAVDNFQHSPVDNFSRCTKIKPIDQVIKNCLRNHRDP